MREDWNQQKSAAEDHSASYAKFLEETPLYKAEEFAFVFHISYAAGRPTSLLVPSPKLDLTCPLCGAVQVFIVVGHEHNLNPEQSTAGHVFVSYYRCTKCDHFHRYFFLRYAEGKMMKIGQYPPWDVVGENRLMKMLGKQHESIYRKGLICESQGFGIAAYAYYRRVLENLLDSLLARVRDAATPEERATFDSGFDRIKGSGTGKEKIKLVKDVLPVWLRPGGHNPLTLLHEALSEGLHDRSDEECLELAADIRTTLEIVVDRTEKQSLEIDALSEGMKRILNRKSKQEGGAPKDS